MRVTQSVERRRTTGSAAAWLALAAIGAPHSASGSCSRGSSPTRLAALRKLAATARRVEEGDLEARAEVDGGDEQREVTIAFNDMTERIGTVLAAPTRVRLERLAPAEDAADRAPAAARGGREG